MTWRLLDGERSDRLYAALERGIGRASARMRDPRTMQQMRAPRAMHQIRAPRTMPMTPPCLADDPRTFRVRLRRRVMRRWQPRFAGCVEAHIRLARILA